MKKVFEHFFVNFLCTFCALTLLFMLNLFPNKYFFQ